MMAANDLRFVWPLITNGGAVVGVSANGSTPNFSTATTAAIEGRTHHHHRGVHHSRQQQQQTAIEQAVANLPAFLVNQLSSTYAAALASQHQPTLCSSPKQMRPSTPDGGIIDAISIGAGDYQDRDDASLMMMLPPNNVDHLQQQQQHQQQQSMECVVCGDKSSGKHYGQFTCEGCKSFFKRSVRRNLVYTCRGQSNCIIDTHHRNQCQYCRFNKCVNAGMKREAVQRGRSTSVVAPFNGGGLTSIGGGVIGNNNAADQSGDNTFNIIEPGSDVASGEVGGMINIADESGDESAVGPMIAAAAPTLRHVSIGAERRGSAVPTVDNVSEIAARLLFAVVDWVRSLPLACNLVLRDQIRLLQASWAELFVVGASQWSSAATILSEAAAASSRNNHGGNGNQISNDIAIVSQQVDKIRALRLDGIEFTSLMTILYFNADASELVNVAAVELLQEKAILAMAQYVGDRTAVGSSSGGGIQSRAAAAAASAASSARLCRLFVRINALRNAIKPTLIEQLFFSHLVGNTPIEALLHDMLAKNGTSASENSTEGLQPGSSVRRNDDSSGCPVTNRLHQRRGVPLPPTSSIIGDSNSNAECALSAAAQAYQFFAAAIALQESLNRNRLATTTAHSSHDIVGAQAATRSLSSASAASSSSSSSTHSSSHSPQILSLTASPIARTVVSSTTIITDNTIAPAAPETSATTEETLTI